MIFHDLCRFGPVLVASAALNSDGFRFRCPLTMHLGAGSLVQGWLSSCSAQCAGGFFMIILARSWGHLFGSEDPGRPVVARPTPRVATAGASISWAPSLQGRSSTSRSVWADLREDTTINPAPGSWPIFGPLEPTAGPGSPGNGPGAGCTKNQPRRPILRPIRGHFVFLGPSAKR